MPKIMLVEDDNNLREIYEARLQAEGYQIVAAKDGEEALVVAKAEKPELIISDIMMPKISGFEMLDILRNTDGLKDVKVIMLTALGQNDDQQKADRLGADRYLVKSQVTLEDIVQVTRELLGDAAKPAAPASPPALAAAATPAPVTPTSTAAPAQPETVTATPAPPPPPEPAPVEPAPAPAVQPAPAPAPPVTPAPAEPATTVQPTVDNTPAASAQDAAALAEPPPVDTSNVSATATGDAQSTDQAEATVESQVEDFVAGATQDAPPPDPNVPVSPAPAEEPAAAETTAAPETLVTPTTAPPIEPAVSNTTPGVQIKPDPVKAAADDKLMAEAAASLAKSTVPEDAPSGGALLSTPAVSGPKETSEGGLKKVIQPIDSKPKKDINALLAVEEAKTAEVQALQPVIVADDPKAKLTSAPANPVIAPPPGAATPEPAIIPNPQTPLPQKEKPADPNSIAL